MSHNSISPTSWGKCNSLPSSCLSYHWWAPTQNHEVKKINLTPEWNQLNCLCIVCIDLMSTDLLRFSCRLFSHDQEYDLPSPSLKIGVTSLIPISFSELNTGVVRPHFHSSSNSVHCSRTPTCAGKDEKKQGHQFYSGKGILYLEYFYKVVKFFLASITDVNLKFSYIRSFLYVRTTQERLKEFKFCWKLEFK